MRRICGQFESPDPSNDDDQMTNQKKILDLMQQVILYDWLNYQPHPLQLQQYGQPPPELADTMVTTISMLP